MLVDRSTQLAFAPAAMVLNLTPGADMMSCLGQRLRAGPRAAMSASLGVGAGCVVHLFAAGLGLSALLGAAPGLFDLIRWAGVVYLVWLVVRALRPRHAFGAAVAVNLLDPKVALFVLASILQFVDPARSAVPGQFLILGGVPIAGGVVINGLVGVFAGGIGQAMVRSTRLQRTVRCASAGIFFELPAQLALDARR